MKVYSEKAKFGLNWIQILVVAVVANLMGGLVFTVTESLGPIWAVHPLLLIIGLSMLHRRTIIGALFLLGLAEPNDPNCGCHPRAFGSAI